MRSLLILLLFILPVGFGNAQSTTVKPVEPNVIGVAFRLEPTTQELKRLPDEPCKEAARSHGLAAVYRGIEVSGKHSAFQIKTGENIEFVFKVGSPEKVALYRFIERGKKRYFDTEQTVGAKGGPQVIKGLPIEVVQFGASYKLTPASPLAPGEYAIMIAGESFTFSVEQ
jgi:hypothetical protein